VVLEGRSVVYHVYKRPWVDFFLRKVRRAPSTISCFALSRLIQILMPNAREKKVSSWYTIVIFTASMQEYADPVIDWLDQGQGLIGGRLFREVRTYFLSPQHPFWV
jgi:CTD nuclear envelope phosphatase 1